MTIWETVISVNMIMEIELNMVNTIGKMETFMMDHGTKINSADMEYFIIINASILMLDIGRMI